MTSTPVWRNSRPTEPTKPSTSVIRDSIITEPTAENADFEKLKQSILDTKNIQELSQVKVVIKGKVEKKAFSLEEVVELNKVYTNQSRFLKEL